jgi:ketosteroid isomerase-like protein
MRFELRYTDVRDLGDRVLALGTTRSVARESGIEQEFVLAVVATFKDGLVTHWKDFGDKESALEAAGLSE